jgi:hypothetical protein
VENIKYLTLNYFFLLVAISDMPTINKVIATGIELLVSKSKNIRAAMMLKEIPARS